MDLNISSFDNSEFLDDAPFQFISETSGSLPGSTADNGDYEDGSDSSLLPSNSNARGPARRKRRRKRMNCTFCRQRKLKCDRNSPCSSCVKRGRETSCIYEIPLSEDGSDLSRKGPYKLNSLEMKTRLDRMENLVLSMMNQPDEPSNTNGKASTAKFRGPDGNVDDDDIGFLKESLGLLKLDSKGKSVYHGDTHWGSLFSEVVEVQDFFRKLREGIYGKGASVDPCFDANEVDNSHDGWTLAMTPTNKITSASDILQMLPNRFDSDVLIERYFSFFEPIFHIVHRPSFQITYEKFWENPESSELIWVSILLGMLSLALQSYKEEDIPYIYQGRALQTWTAWQNGIEICGQAGKLIDKPSLMNLRSMLLWMLVQARGSPSYDWVDKSWTSMGMIVRVAQSMGMHRDPKWFVMSPFEAEERRRIWALLQFFDIFHSSVQGLPLSIRPDEQDVEEPSNVDDKDLMPEYGHLPPPKDLTQQTSSTFMIFRGRLNKHFTKIFGLSVSIKTKANSVSYEDILSMDSQVRSTYSSAPPWLSTPCDRSLSSDSEEIMMQRFILEIDFLKIIIVLHRSFSSRGLTNLRYRRSREESINASVTMLNRQKWFYTSMQAKSLRLRFWWIVSCVTFPYFIHATLMIAISVLNNFDNITMEQRLQQVEAIESSYDIMLTVAKTNVQVSKQSLIIKVMLSQIQDLVRMPASERAARLEEARRKTRTISPQESVCGSDCLNEKSNIIEEPRGVGPGMSIATHPDGRKGITLELDTEEVNLNSFNRTVPNSNSVNTSFSNNGSTSGSSSNMNAGPLTVDSSAPSSTGPSPDGNVIKEDETFLQYPSSNTPLYLSDAYMNPIRMESGIDFFDNDESLRVAAQSVGVDDWDTFMRTMQVMGSDPLKTDSPR